MGALWQTDSSKPVVPTDSVEEAPLPKKSRRRYAWRSFWLLLVIILIVAGFAIEKEVRTSRFQAREFSRFAASLSYSMHPGPSDSIFYPGAGPFDKRLGYSALGDFCRAYSSAIM